ncbi:hypothetical protein NIES208_17995 [[Limnothrix rosea] IAM M-220]|nr:hypothetical protein NIES208_17995 [[Limnothrix rosea] IAM M-220]
MNITLERLFYCGDLFCLDQGNGKILILRKLDSKWLVVGEIFPKAFVAGVAIAVRAAFLSLGTMHLSSEGS